jgi:uncharacterized protein YbbK (DUF523 family)/uncharacterized protein YbgA (DUF1722 family)
MNSSSFAATTRPRIAVSACLLGEAVRYDATDKRDAFVGDQLGECVELIGVCPEFELGMGAPRETIEIVDRDGELLLLGVESGVDHTVAMREFAERRVGQLLRAGVDGFVLKKRSPSCGVRGVPVLREGDRVEEGVGRFAAAVAELAPELPVADEAELAAPGRDDFLNAAFAGHRWRQFVSSPNHPGWRDLADFHALESSLLLACDERRAVELTRIVDGAAEKRQPLGPLVLEEYCRTFRRAVRRPISLLDHQRALTQLLGHLRSDSARQAANRIVQQMCAGIVCVESAKDSVLALLRDMTERSPSSPQVAVPHTKRAAARSSCGRSRRSLESNQGTPASSTPQVAVGQSYWRPFPPGLASDSGPGAPGG